MTLYVNVARVLMIVSVVSGIGCSSTSESLNTRRGGIGRYDGDTASEVIVGASIGGVEGEFIARYMESQAEELQKELRVAASVRMVEEGIRITLPAESLFEAAEPLITEQGKAELMTLSSVLRRFDETNLLIEGHTDANGPEEQNRKLSDHRAVSVADFLRSTGISNSRLTTVGYGESQSNLTAGNPRRIEIAIYANEKLKERAASNQR